MRQTEGRIGGAHLSCLFGGTRLSRPLNWNGSTNLIDRTRRAGPSEGRVGGACLSCPQTRNGLSNLAQWTRQAGPSERRIGGGTVVVYVRDYPPWNTSLNSGENYSLDSGCIRHTGPAQHHDSFESGRTNKPPLRLLSASLQSLAKLPSTSGTSFS